MKAWAILHGEAALGGDLHALVGEVAVDIADGRDVGRKAGAIRVAQAVLDVEVAVIISGYIRVGAEVLAQSKIAGVCRVTYLALG